MKPRIRTLAGVGLALSSLFFADGAAGISHAGFTQEPGAMEMIDIHATEARLRDHLKALTVGIGERSVLVPGNLMKTAGYIRDFYGGIGIEARLEPYDYHGVEVVNVVAEVQLSPRPSRRVLIGAHYDSVAGSVGADDNASAVAVQLETARQVTALRGCKDLDVTVVFVSFALEEPPVYGTRFMGSRVYAEQARRRNERIDAMLCLEMVGYTCPETGCQSYPFPDPFLPAPADESKTLSSAGIPKKNCYIQ